MKESKYNYFANDNDKVICMNGMSGNVFSISKEAYIEMKKILNAPNDSCHDKEIINHLYALKFLIDDETNEMQELKERYKRTINHPLFRLIINPTQECNFRCWYCYESHNNGHMSVDTINRIMKFVERTMQREDIQTFHLSWFGGEPLLYYKDIMYPIAKFAHEKAKEYGKSFVHTMTSNGYFLTDKVIEKCVETELSSIQVTLDGNRELHNKTRNHNGQPSFDRIINNAINFCRSSKQNKIILRVNYTDEVIKNDLKEVFERIPTEIRPQMEISFHRVWQTIGIQKSTSNVINNTQYVEKLGFALSHNTSYALYNGKVCYADSRNYANINFDGNVYRCTANDYVKKDRLGYLDEEGNIIWEKQELLKKAEELTNFDNSQCSKCKNLAICGGLCFNRKMTMLTTGKYSCVKAKLDTGVEAFVKEYYYNRLKKRQAHSTGL